MFVNAAPNLYVTEPRAVSIGFLGRWGRGGADGALTTVVCWQVLLCNPICVVGYTLASWRFFRERIEEEEITLIHFFGEEYLEYKRKVPSGLPFIKGVKVEL